MIYLKSVANWYQYNIHFEILGIIFKNNTQVNDSPKKEKKRVLKIRGLCLLISKSPFAIRKATHPPSTMEFKNQTLILKLLLPLGLVGEKMLPKLITFF